MIYYLTALLNGFFNSINRMTNVRAGKLFGTANGALINYVEATVLSLLLDVRAQKREGAVVGLHRIRPMVGLSRERLRAARAAAADRRDAALEHARFVNSHAGQAISGCR